MKSLFRFYTRIFHTTLLLVILKGFTSAFAQAPDISYPTPQSFPVNKIIIPIAPQNTGGTVPPNIYGLDVLLAGGNGQGLVDGPGTSAEFFSPYGIAIDKAGNFYVGEQNNYTIRKITAAGDVSTYAGARMQGHVDGSATAARFDVPDGVATDANGNIYVADYNYVRKIDPNGNVSTIAGNGQQGFADGQGTAASFNNATSLAVDQSGNIYVADFYNYCIRKITPGGMVTTFAGNGQRGGADGQGQAATFDAPFSIAIDQSGNIYVGDMIALRKITPGGMVTTIAGGIQGYADGMGSAAKFEMITGLAIDPSGIIYAVDTGEPGGKIRKIDLNGNVTTLTVTGDYGNYIGAPWSDVLDGKGNLYYTSADNNWVRKISLTGYTIDKPLPPGLTFDPTTGTISGTPTATSPPTDYLITAYNTTGSSSTTVSIAVTGLTPVVTTSTVTGTISACVGSASASPNVAQFTVAGTALTGDITITPPPGFDLSLTAIGGYSTSLTLKQIGGTVISNTIYVRSSASDPAGPISGNIQVTTPGATADVVPVTGTVNAIPTVQPVSNQTVNNGAPTTAINFTGTAPNYTWTNTTPSIGLPANGIGNIPPFTATNTGSSAVIATVTVTPSPAGFAYVGNYSSNTVSVVNLATNSVSQTLNVGTNPWGVALTPDGSKAYVSNQGSNNVSVISTASNTVIATVNVGTSPEGITVSPDGSKVYVANLVTNNVSVISTVSNMVIATIKAGVNSKGVVVSPDNSTIYVANGVDNTVSVISTTTYATIATLNVGSAPEDIAISPDGSKLYVVNLGDGTVSVINTKTNAKVTIPVGASADGIAISPDGSKVYVSIGSSTVVAVIDAATNKVTSTLKSGNNPAGISLNPNGTLAYVTNFSDNTVSVINIATNTIVTTIQAGSNPTSIGRTIATNIGCSGTPVTFTITVNAAPAVITLGPVTGSILGCTGSPSESPNVEQFSISGSGLTGNITITAPPGFEVSADGTDFSTPWIIVEQAGIVPSTTIYVRSTATASGNISGNLVISSPGVANQNVAVTGTINATPTVDPVAGQTFNNGNATTAINFTGTAGAYSWTNDTPGIGLPANGFGNIPSFIATNTTGSPIIANITVTPFSMGASNCSVTPVRFTITVNPSPPVITFSGALSGLSTIYGIASSSESFTVSGTNATAGILVTAPQGFEVSTDNQTFGATATAGQAGAISLVPVYIRLTATSPAGNYSGNIKLSIAGAGDVNVNMPKSTVEKAILTVTAPDVTRGYGTTNPVFVPGYQGFVNGDDPSSLATQPELTTSATLTSPVGKYTIHVSGGSSTNYFINPVDGTLTIIPALSEIVIPNAFTPNGDGINDYWNIKSLEDFPDCLVSVYSRYGNLVYQSKGYPRPWDGTRNGSPVPTGTYYYIINLQNGLQLLSGYVAVLR